jgi:hypothetical protein
MTKLPSLTGSFIASTATLVSSRNYTALSVTHQTMSEQFKEFKVIKLPRNGPKPGQSTRAWLYGKEQEEKEFRRVLDSQDFQGHRK